VKGDRSLGEALPAVYAVPHELAHYFVGHVLGMNPTYHFWEMGVETDEDFTEHPRKSQAMNLAPLLLWPLAYPIHAVVASVIGPGMVAELLAVFLTLTWATPSPSDSGAARDLAVVAKGEFGGECECGRCGGEAESYVAKREAVACTACGVLYDPQRVEEGEEAASSVGGSE